MNKFFYTLTLILLVCITSAYAQRADYTVDSLSMYSSYSNDIFYSMSDGQVANIPRAGWDIAFYTAAFSAGIIINEGSGAQLYKYPNGDTSSWASVDTVGLSTWDVLYNSPDYWEDGAFNNNSTGHPDYGWGVYNMVTHSVIGDSLYIIHNPSFGYKKIWIVNKISVENIYNIKYADLDGNNEQTIEIDVKPFVSKNFIYFSLTTNETIDREPASDWDILFTKYIDLTEDMSGNWSNYLVTGATSNVNRGANKFTEVGVDFEDWSSKPLDSLKNVIGYNWKNFDMTTFSWTVDDSTAFFIKNYDGDIYKLIFTYWAGSTSGDFVLNKKIVSLTSTNDIENTESNIAIYPNPANRNLNIEIEDTKENLTLVITDISGREVVKESILNTKSFNISEFNRGIYFVTVYNENFRETQKLIIN